MNLAFALAEKEKIQLENQLYNLEYRMNIKTKKYKMETSAYVKYAMVNVVKEWWWAFLVPLALVALTFVLGSHWPWIVALVATILYLLFWAVQFVGVTQHPNFKMMFEKVNYEINSQQVLMKLNAKQGMPMKWDMIKEAYVKKDAFVLIINRAQLVYLPHSIFNNANDISFVTSILKRKGYVK